MGNASAGKGRDAAIGTLMHAGRAEPGVALLGTFLSYLVSLSHMHTRSSLKQQGKGCSLQYNLWWQGEDGNLDI